MEIKSGGFVTYVISLSRFAPPAICPPDLPNWGGVGSWWLTFPKWRGEEVVCPKSQIGGESSMS